MARVLLTASTLKSIPPSLLGDLFFRPIVGDTDIAGLLEDMLLLSNLFQPRQRSSVGWAEAGSADLAQLFPGVA